MFLYILLQLLHLDKRREYLYQLQEFLVTDNSRNWRFRAELAEYVFFWMLVFIVMDILKCYNHRIDVLQ